MHRQQQQVKESEARFHDVRLSGAGAEIRDAQSKYYWAIKNWDARFCEMVRNSSKGKQVLEIGCFNGESTVDVASVATKVCAIDISSAAVASTVARAKAAGLGNVQAELGDAEKLPYADASMDTVFCAGVLHHVDVALALREIYRVLVPGGRAIVREPLAHNPFINAYRRLTPSARTVDEHPLTARDLKTMRAVFDEVAIDYFGLLSLMAVPLRGRAIGGPLRRTLVAVDDFLFNNPLLGRYCWHVNAVLGKAPMAAVARGA